MVSIKEIAKHVNVSQTTASIVLNGKGDKIGIAAKTQQKILEAARTLGYSPNISARRLRNGEETISPVIALFWPVDIRSSLIGSFLNSVQKELSSYDQEYDLLIQPFVGSHIKDIRSLITGTRFNGAIITNLSEEDEKFLEQSSPNVPIVLYQRYSEKYSYVNTDNYGNGREIARLYAARGHQNVSIIIPDVDSSAARLRRDGFLEGVKEFGLTLAEGHIAYGSYSEKGGYNACKELLKYSKNTTALFVLSDHMAVGALAALDELGIKVPDDMELVSHDDYEIAQFTIPSLTSMHIPVDDMAKGCVNILTDLISHTVAAPVRKHYDSHLVVRNSCGGFTDFDKMRN